MRRAGLVLVLGLGGLTLLSLAALPLAAQNRGHFSIGPSVPVGPSFPGASTQMGTPLTTPVGSFTAGFPGHHAPQPFFLIGFKAGGTHFLIGSGGIPPRFRSRFAPIHRRSVLFLAPAIYESVPVTAPAAESPEAAAPTGAQPEDSPEAKVVLLVLKNGSVYLAIRYWEEAGRLFFVTADGVEAAVALNDLDMEKTIRVNAERGVDFLLPLAPRRTPVEPKPGQKHIYVPITFPGQ